MRRDLFRGCAVFTNGFMFHAKINKRSRDFRSSWVLLGLEYDLHRIAFRRFSGFVVVFFCFFILGASYARVDNPTSWQDHHLS